jgi:release factor glutamine methyltransferase
LIKDINFYNKKIKEIWPDDSHIDKEFIFYIKEKLGLNDLSIFIDNHKFSKEEENLINDFIEKKKKGIPLDYILQKSSFYQNDFFVDERALIPRPETEILVDHINNLNLNPGMKILDAGVGSGCIGISLAKLNPKTCVYGLDYSSEALKVAKINKEKFNLDNFYLINSNWLEPLKENSFDIIISNPPYVGPFDPHLEQLKHEPISALVAEQNGLRDFDFISSQAIKVLKDRGLLAFEHGNHQANQVKKIMSKYGFKNIILIDDYQSQPRITMGKK